MKRECENFYITKPDIIREKEFNKSLIDVIDVD